MELNPAVVATHKQLDALSCIPMSVEYVLKLTGKVLPNYFDLQKEWNNKADGSFAQYDGREILGVRFRQLFAAPRDDDFPMDQFFRTIEAELLAGRYVIISLRSPGGWHMFVIYGTLPNGEFKATSKVPNGPDWNLNNVRSLVRQMKGTDILTYEFTDESSGKPTQSDTNSNESGISPA